MNAMQSDKDALVEVESKTIFLNGRTLNTTESNSKAANAQRILFACKKETYVLFCTGK